MSSAVEKKVENENDEYPSTILVIIHGLKNKTKHEILKKVANELNINLIIPTEEQDNKKLNDEQRIDLYKNLIIKYKPNLLIAQSSGGNVISSLVTNLKIWNGPTWIISARLIEPIYEKNYNDLPLLFSHGTNDNISYMKHLSKNKFSRCKLIEFNGDHYAQNLFTNDNSIKNIKELIKICYNLRLKEPKNLPKKSPMTINEMMKQKFKSKQDSNK